MKMATYGAVQFKFGTSCNVKREITFSLNSPKLCHDYSQGAGKGVDSAQICPPPKHAGGDMDVDQRLSIPFCELS